MEYTKKSAFIKKYGDVSNIQIGPQPLPPLDDKIEVEVKICGMNFADIYLREGLMQHPLPYILGIECTGVVTAIGPTAKTNFSIGTRVICYDFNGGLYSDRIRIDPSKCYQLPDYISFETGAAVFVNYLTAYLALYEAGNLKEGDDVFVKSCAGGVGCAVTQLAKLKKDVKVYGTASSGKEKFALDNGVDHVFSYENLEADIGNVCPNGFDVIIENESGQSFQKMTQKLKPLGRMISLGANDLIGKDERLTYFKLLKFVFWTKLFGSIDRQAMMVRSQIIGALHLGNIAVDAPEKVKTALTHIFELIRDSRIKPKIDSTWDIDRIEDATTLLVRRRNKGKVLLRMSSDL